MTNVRQVVKEAEHVVVAATAGAATATASGLLSGSTAVFVGGVLATASATLTAYLRYRSNRKAS